MCYAALNHDTDRDGSLRRYGDFVPREAVRSFSGRLAKNFRPTAAWPGLADSCKRCYESRSTYGVR
jgi:hypothetical protein